MRIGFPIWLVFAAALFAGTAVQAATISTVKDAYIQKGTATTNYGNAIGITVKGRDATTTRKGYMQFDLSGITDPSSIIEAQLDLVVSQNSSGGGSLPYTYTVEVFGLNDGVNEAWVEGNGGSDNSPAGEITWSNAPANNNDNTFTSSATSLGSFTLTSTVDGDLVGQVFSLNNAALLSFFNADTDGLATIMLRRTDGSGSNNLSFASKEHATLSPPQMTLTIPEPATLCLVSLGLIGMGLRRRRES